MCLSRPVLAAAWSAILTAMARPISPRPTIFPMRFVGASGHRCHSRASRLFNATGTFPDAVVTGDFNGDGRLDMAIADSVSNDVAILLGQGDGTFQNVGTVPVGTFRRRPSPAISPATAGSTSRLPTLAGSTRTTSSFAPAWRCSWATAMAPSSRAVPYHFATDPAPWQSVISTRDNQPDLAVALSPDDTPDSGYRGRAPGRRAGRSFARRASAAVGGSPRVLLAGDFTGDGHRSGGFGDYFAGRSGSAARRRPGKFPDQCDLYHAGGGRTDDRGGGFSTATPTSISRSPAAFRIIWTCC